MNNIKYLLVISITILMCSLPLMSQEPAQAKPLELPNFIIEGKEQLNIQSGYKQFPDSTKLLTSQELNQINPLEKQQSMLLPPKSFPTKIMDYTSYAGYLKGEFGRFTTPKFEGGWGFNISDYSLFLDGNLESSAGHVNNADYTKFNARLTSDYIAPAKYWVFGGSRTNTLLEGIYRTYKLYAVNTAPTRNNSGFDARISTDGTFNGYMFSTGAGFKSSGIRQNNNNFTDNALSAFLNLNKTIYDFVVGGGVSLDFHNFRGLPFHFLQGEAMMKYIDTSYTLSLKGGIQEVENTNDLHRAGLLIDAGFTYRLNKMLTFDAGIKNDLQKNSFMDKLDINPYISDTVNIDFANRQQMQVSATYHPDINLIITANASYTVIDREPYFYSANDGSFLLGYSKTNKISAKFESQWEAGINDKLLVNLLLNNERFTDISKTVPYTYPYSISARYERLFLSGDFSAAAGLIYNGEKYADIQNKNKISGYFDLKIKASAKLVDNLSIYAGIDNLLNSEVMIWEGYRERSTFFYAGLSWKF
jgi:hypothetical protein